MARNTPKNQEQSERIAAVIIPADVRRNRAVYAFNDALPIIRQAFLEAATEESTLTITLARS